MTSHWVRGKRNTVDFIYLDFGRAFDSPAWQSHKQAKVICFRSVFPKLWGDLLRGS